EVVWRRSNEATFAQHRLGNDRCYFFTGDDALERVFEIAGAVEIAGWIFQVVRTAITVGERDPVNVAGEGREAGLVRMRLAGKRQRHHGAAVESVFEGDHCGTLGISAGNLYCVLDGFSTAVHEESLLGKLAGRD